MTIQSDSDWYDVEAKALAAEQREAESFLAVEPVPEPTMSQQLLWATTELAKTQAKLVRQRGLVSAAWMWIQAGRIEEAVRELDRIILDV